MVWHGPSYLKLPPMARAPVEAVEMSIAHSYGQKTGSVRTEENNGLFAHVIFLYLPINCYNITEGKFSDILVPLGLW